MIRYYCRKRRNSSSLYRRHSLNALWRKAKRILFNIYASDEFPIFVRELQEIDDFFDQLDPNIEVIWGTATDDSLGEDAKVTILATGMEDSLKDEVKTDVYRNQDEYFENLIPLLYKPAKKATLAQAIATQQEIEFDVEPAPEPEPAKVPDPVPEPEPEPMVKKEPTTIDKLKIWLSNFMKDESD